MSDEDQQQRNRNRSRASAGGDGQAKNESRDSGSGGGGGGGDGSGQGQGGQGNRGKKNRRRNKRRRGGRRRSGTPPREEGTGFWGEADKLPAPQNEVRMTEDPGAVPRSLGTPPLPGHEHIAQHYFELVYDRAVTTASALAAAGGLIEPDELTEVGEEAEDDEG